MRQIVAALLGLAFVGQSTASWAKSDSEESTLEQIGYGTGSVVGSAVYFPFKAAFCILGRISSGFTLKFVGDAPASETSTAQ